MVLKVKSNILKIMNSKYILIPATMFNDSAFPFDENDLLDIEIDDNQMIINKTKNKK